MTIFYPDISSFQAGVSLKGALAVSCKATQGTGYTNPDYARAEKNAAANGAFFFAYHFLMAGNGAAQAQHCFSVTGKTPVMLDVEEDGTSRPGVADVVAFVRTLRALGGVIHLVYLPHWYWQQIGSPPLAELPQLGLALVSSAYTSYTDADSGTGWQPYGGVTPAVWQYTDALSFNGYSVDFNAFRGTHPGDQSPAAIADTLKQFESIVRTGIMPPSGSGPYRHVVPAGYGHNIEYLAQSRNWNVAGLVSYSLQYVNAGHAAIISSYLALHNALKAVGAPSPPLPEGFVYYTVNP